MSRFIDQLNAVASATPQPIGFRATHPASVRPRIQLVASLTQIGDTDQLADCIDGADAVILHQASSPRATKITPKKVKSLPNMPWGVWLEGSGDQKIETFTEAGCDFTILPADSPVSAAPQDDHTGKILEVAPSLSNDSLRAINDLPVDAILVTDLPETGGSVAWHHLINFQRLANILTKPLLVMVPLKVTASELKALWEAGIDGVVVEVDGGQTGALQDLRRIISELPPRSLRRRGKTEALLPRMGGGESGISKTEEEEEEEEE
jgi:hypothetical protein